MDEEIKKGLFRKTLTDFSGGMQDSIDPIKLADNQFPFIYNGILYHNTGIKSLIARNGLRRINTNTPASSSSLINMFEYRKDSGTNVMLVKGNNTLEKIASPYTGSYSSVDGSDSATKAVKFLKHKDLAYIFDRNDGSTWYTNKVYDGTTLYDFGIAPADNSNLSGTAIEGAGTFANGWYHYFITFLYDDNTESSVYLTARIDTTLKVLLYYLACEVSGGNKDCIQLTGIPTGSARVTARKIYRTKCNGSTWYYLNTIWDNTTTSYNDITSNDDELTEELTLPFVSKPMLSKCAVVHKKRLFNANLKENLTLTAPTIVSSPVSATNSTGLPISINTAIKVPYKYAKMYIYPYTYNSYAIVRGDLTANDEVVTLPKDATGLLFAKVTHTIPTWTEPFNGYTGIFRSPNFAIYKVTRSSNICTVELERAYPISAVSSSYLTEFPKPGDTVYIHGVTDGGFTMDDGEYTVIAMGANYATFTVASTGSDGSSTVDYGGCYIKNIYRYIGGVRTGVTSFVDTVFDCAVTNNVYTKNSVINQSSNKNYPQTIIWTDPEKSEVFTGEDILNNETGAITALFSEDNGVVIFKENDIYKLFTDGLEAQWTMKRLVKGIGCQFPYSVVQLSNGQYMWYSGGKFYHWVSGYNDPTEIGIPIKNEINGVGSITEMYGAYYKTNNWVVFVSNSTSRVFVYDLTFKTWYVWKTNTFTSSPALNLYAPFCDINGTLYFGSRNNRLYSYNLSSFKDELYNEGFVDTNIHLSGKTKTFDNTFLNISKMSAKIYYGGRSTLTNKFTLTPIINGTNGTVITKSMVVGNSRVTGKQNIEEAQQFELLFDAEIDNLFQLKGLMFEYREDFKEQGWNYDT